MKLHHRFAVWLALTIGLIAIPANAALPADQDHADSIWLAAAADGTARIRLHFFWSRTCPHCTRARPFVEQLSETLPWLELDSHELTGHPDNVRRFVALAAATGSEAASVPSFFFCGIHLAGYDDEQGMGAVLRALLEDCHRQTMRAAEPAVPRIEASRQLHVPVIGEIVPKQWSLPVLTLVLAALDSFNPCAFFVLLFLLSLLVNARDRRKMLIIGGVFVVVSGTVYFLFMSAWLNLFLVTGQLGWINVVAGLFAITIAVINIKDFFWLHKGVSLSIPDAARPGLYRRMRGLVAMEQLPPMLLGTLLLAIVANAYELLCTAGFPMVFTRILTLNQLSTIDYYAYLAAYCLIYIVPLLVIVGLFTLTLGRRKLQENEGRILKLVSGVMMLGLGLLLLIEPEALTHPLAGVGLIVGALLVGMVTAKLSASHRAA
jgi:glutaredoxin